MAQKKKRMNVDVKKVEGSKLFVVDANAVMHTNYVPLSIDSGENAFTGNKYNRFRPRELSWEVDGEQFNTSSLYGLLRIFTMYGFEHDYVFCFDTPKNVRKLENPDYKSGRGSKDFEYIAQLVVARDMLESVGYRVHAVEEFEGDDFVVETVNRFKGEYDNVFVLSNDYDLGQTVDDNVTFINSRKRLGDITIQNYEEMLGCPYNSVILYKAMVGDKSDGVKGIYRFGPKRFYKFLEQEGIYNDLPNIRKERREFFILKDTIHLDEEERAAALDSLRMVVPRVPKGYDEWDIKRNIDKDKFEFFLERYGMKSIIKQLRK